MIYFYQETLPNPHTAPPTPSPLKFSLVKVIDLPRLTPNRYGRPDLLLKREFDMSVKLRMSSVRYIHTARFQNEVVAFFQQFSQLQDMLGQIRASTAGREVSN